MLSAGRPLSPKHDNTYLGSRPMVSVKLYTCCGMLYPFGAERAAILRSMAPNRRRPGEPYTAIHPGPSEGCRL
jgi:hypothetical protein